LEYFEDKEDINKISGYVVCIVEYSSKTISQRILDQFMMHTSIFLRPLFTQECFLTLSTYDVNKVIYILMDKGQRETWKNRVKNVINQFKESRNPLTEGYHISIGVGRMINRLTEINKSLQTALEAISIQRKMKWDEPLYEFLHVYRLVSQVEKMGNLNEYIQDYLAPVIEYDQKHNGELIKTLQYYYECNGSKQRTAERLFIVRQTLYLRIQKLEELLGTDFMSPERRLMIEFALYAYRYLQAGISPHKN
jgi:purine catabolism regulator